MSTTITARRQSVPVIVIGAILAVSGFLTALSGTVVLLLFGSGNTLGSGEHPVSTPTSAVVTDLGHIQDINGYDFLTGSPTLHLSASSERPAGVFVGVGPTADVQRYLSDVAVDQVTDLELSPFRLDMQRHGGFTVAAAPGEQSFWVASAESSATADVAWKLEDGSYQMVIMNADGSSGLFTHASIGVSLPDSSGIWTIVLAIGVLTTVGGAALIRFGAKPIKVVG